MSSKVWMSSVLSNHNIGLKQGARTKFFGHEWNPASLEIPLSPDDVHAASRRHREGFALERSEFPEAIAVWDQKRFKKVKEIFMAGPFYAVQGKLAEVLARFDLGEGGLLPFTIYQADLETPYPGEFFLLNFGCRKDTLVPESSKKVSKFVVVKKTGQQRWKVDDWIEDEVVLRDAALEGPDLWFEEALYNKIFVSDALAQAIMDIGMKDVFALEECRIAGEAQ
ncbi:hypothetical protein [Qipengyuania sp. NPDC077563]|uniref:hypothetical protein n=1 Tax=Qipengyuania sp. NPDC077563 TaxID=3364497 RepID=UPI00384DC828